MNETRLAAIKAIYTYGWGYVNDLTRLIGEELISEFASVGFIRYGFTRTRKTWIITNLGRNYVKDTGLA